MASVGRQQMYSSTFNRHDLLSVDTHTVFIISREFSLIQNDTTKQIAFTTLEETQTIAQTEDMNSYHRLTVAHKQMCLFRGSNPGLSRKATVKIHPHEADCSLLSGDTKYCIHHKLEIIPHLTSMHTGNTTQEEQL